MTRNRTAINKTKALLEANPERYDHADWFRAEQRDSYWRAPAADGSLAGVLGICIAGAAVASSLRYDILTDGLGLGHPVEVATGHRKDWYVAGADVLGLTYEEAKLLFNQHWLPKPGLSVSDVLTALAHGVDVEAVTDDDVVELFGVGRL